MGLLSLRSRLLQSLILALLGLTFYTYYRTTASEIQQYAFARAYNRSTSLYDSSSSHSQQQPQQQALQQQQQSNNTNSNNSNSNNSETSASALSTWQSRQNASDILLPPLLVNGTYNNQQQQQQQSNVASSNSSTVITVISSSSSSSSQSALSSSSTSTTTTTTTTVAPSTAPIVIDKNSARAIYAAGHSVSVADKCPEQGKYMDLVIIIMSAPTHFEARTAIRQTWGHFGQRRDIGIVFMLGSTSDTKFERNLEREQDMYGDIIRGNFVDSYFNLTLKTISTLEWVDTYCSEVKFVLKTDDDMFINVPRLVSFINKHRKDKNVIFGKVARKWKPVRNKSSKYFVSLAQYKSVFYPDFCTGPAYLMSNDVIRNLHEAALNETFLKLEDVFVTGIVASKLGIKRVHANEFLNRKISYSPCNVQRGISIHMVKYSEQFDLWKKLLDGKVKCK